MERRQLGERRKVIHAVNDDQRKSHGRRLADRRAGRRHQTPVALRILRLDHNQNVLLEGRISDCSTTGIRLIMPLSSTYAPCQVTDRLMIEIREMVMSPLTLVVEVIWTQPSGNEILVGCQFQTSMVIDQLTRLRSFMDRSHSGLASPLTHHASDPVSHHSV